MQVGCGWAVVHIMEVLDQLWRTGGDALMLPLVTGSSFAQPKPSALALT